MQYNIALFTRTSFVIIEQTIFEKLEREFSPVHLAVINESHMHSVPANSETHFKVIIVSETFAEIRSVKRHQLVYGVLAEELAGEVHALAIHTYSPTEWQQAGHVPDSPNCHGGSKSS